MPTTNEPKVAPAPSTEHVDVLVIGAGLSGVAAGYYLQTRCPTKTYAILEARADLGGTWDLFRYPGIRSDSDMFTLGYSFRPWIADERLADGPSIKRYIRETAEAYGIDRKIRYGQRVEAARWSSQTNRWSVTVRDVASGDTRELSAGFLFSCAGYYDYDAGYTPDFPGRERFRGRIVHPQRWTDDVDYEGKRVVVIGSGATAVTLVPELAKRAAHVTMLQRSPTYVLSLPGKDAVATWLSEHTSPRVTHHVTRWKNVLVGMAFYNWCKRFPEHAKKVLVGEVTKALGRSEDTRAAFTPTYDPWDQRVCVVPDGDLFEAIREGRASVVTDHLETFTETGLRLRSGRELEADLVVTATGLVLKFLGGITVLVDGKRVDPSEHWLYKGMMASEVPNLAIALGYTNASWTLKCELTCEYVCRLLEHMDRRGHVRACAHRPAGVEPAPLIDFSSGYVQRALSLLPKQGARYPWRLYQNYLFDVAALRHAPIEDADLELS